VNGTTWTELLLPTTWGITSIKGIDALDANHVLAVGNNGKIMWSANAAAATPTWSRPAVAPTAKTLLGAQMLSATTWIVVGDNETILRTTDGGAHWIGVTSPNAPTLTITSPTTATMLGSPTLSIAGNSTDGRGIGVANVEVRIQKSGPLYWNGTAWVASENTWIPATMGDPGDGWDTWETQVPLGSTAGVGTMVVWARATDGLGLKSTAYAWVSSDGSSPVAASTITPTRTSQTIAYGGTATLVGKLTSGGSALAGRTVAILPSATGTTKQTDGNGNFAFPVKPTVKTTYTLRFEGDGVHAAKSIQVVVTPHAKINTPVVPSRVKHTKSFKAYAYLYPKHTAGTKVLTFYFQKKNSKGKYVTVKSETVTGKSASTSSNKVTSASARLSAGRWRVVARHSDASHASTDSSRRYFRVY